MSGDLADIIGLIGSATFIIAYAYANVAETMDKLLFNAVNLFGAALLLYSLSVHFNLAAFVLEIAWAIIACFGVVQGLRERANRKRA
jgi:hypothetical protein